MATYYWVGGDGEWNRYDGTHWSTTSGGPGGTSAYVANIVSIPANLVTTATTSSTTPSGGNNNDGWWRIDTPFGHYIFDLLATSFYVKTNGTITWFGTSSGAPSAKNPRELKIHIAANIIFSTQRIYYQTTGTSGSRVFELRSEGTDFYSGTLGNPNRVWSMRLYENLPGVIDLDFGIMEGTGISGVYNTTDLVTAFTPTANTAIRITTSIDETFYGPTGTDTAIFDANSVTTTTFISARSEGGNYFPYVGNLIVAGNLVNDLLFTGGTPYIRGNLIFNSNRASATGTTMVFVGSGSGVTSNSVISTANVTMQNLRIDGNVNCLLTSDLRCNQLFLAQGNLSCGNVTIRSNYFSTLSTPRGYTSLSLDSCRYIIRSPSSTLGWNITNPQLELFAGNSTLIIDQSIGSGTNFSAGFSNLAYANVILQAGNKNLAVSGAATFGNLNIIHTGNSTVYPTYSFANNITVSGTLSTHSSGNLVTERIQMISNNSSAQVTVNAASVSLRNVDFSGINAVGSWSGTNLGDLSNNSNIVFTSNTIYWANSLSSTWTANNWSYSSSGPIDNTIYPLVQDTVVFTDNFPETGNTVTIPSTLIHYVPSIDTTSRTAAMTISAANVRLAGNFKLGNSTTITSSGVSNYYRFVTQRTHEFSVPAGVNLGNVSVEDGGKLLLQSNLTAYGNLTFTAGNIWLNGYTANVGALLSPYSNVRVLGLENSQLQIWSALSQLNPSVAANNYALTCYGANLTVQGKPDVTVYSVPNYILYVISHEDRGGGQPRNTEFNVKIVGTSGNINTNGATFNDFDLTEFTGTLIPPELFIVGNLSLNSSTIVTNEFNSINFWPYNRTSTLNANGAVISSNVKIDNMYSSPVTPVIPGNVKLLGNLTLGSGKYLNPYRGGLQLNNFHLTANSIARVDTNSFTYASIDFASSSKIYINGTNRTVFNFGPPETYGPMILIGTPDVIFIGNHTTGQRSVQSSQGPSDNGFNMYVTSGSDNFYISGNVNHLDFTGFSGELRSSGRVISGNITFSPSMSFQDDFVYSYTELTPPAGTTSYLVDNGLELPIHFRVYGAGNVKLTSNLSLTGREFFVFGNLDMSGYDVSSNRMTISGGKLITGGANINLRGGDDTFNGYNCFTSISPIIEGTANILINSTVMFSTISSNVAVGNQKINLYISGSNGVAMSGAVNNLDFADFSGTYTPRTKYIYGNLILSSGMALTKTSNATIFSGNVVTQRLVTQEKVYDQPIRIQGEDNTLQLVGNLTANTMSILTGTLDLNDNKLTANAIGSANISISSGGGGGGGGGGSATITPISLNLQGAAALTADTVPDFEGNYGSEDDAFYQIDLPWAISYLGQSYTTIYVSTNSYVTFGAKPADTYDQEISWSYDAATPPIPKLMVKTADGSAQRIYYGVEGNTYRIRFEGHFGYSGGVLGSPTIVWELTFYQTIPNQFDLHVGDHGENSELNGVYSDTEEIVNFNSYDNYAFRVTTSGPGGGPAPGPGYVYESGIKANINFQNQSSIEITGNNYPVWAFPNLTNVNFTGNVGNIKLSYNGADGTRIINHGANIGSPNKAANFWIPQGSDTIEFSGYFRDLDYQGYTGNLVLGSSYLSGSLPANVNLSISNPVTFASNLNLGTVNSISTLIVAGGNLTLNGNFTIASNSSLVHTGGDINFNNQIVSLGSFVANGNAVSTLNLGSGNINLTGTGVVWNVTTDPNVTINSENVTILLANTAGNISFAGGSRTYKNLRAG